MSFTFAGAEVGATYNYTFTSNGGIGFVASSGVIATATDQITGIDISGLPDGTITLAVTLADTNGNTGSSALDTETKDATVPSFDGSNSTPVHNATDVSLTADIILDFNENIGPDIDNIILYNSTDGANVETFNVLSDSDGATTTPSAGKIGFVNDKVYINPTDDLLNDKTYTFWIDATAIDDLAGNSLPNMTINTYSFTTIAVPSLLIGAWDFSTSTIPPAVGPMIPPSYPEFTDIPNIGGTIATPDGSNDSNASNFAQIDFTGFSNTSLTDATVNNTITTRTTNNLLDNSASIAPFNGGGGSNFEIKVDVGEGREVYDLVVTYAQRATTGSSGFTEWSGPGISGFDTKSSNTSSFTVYQVATALPGEGSSQQTATIRADSAGDLVIDNIQVYGRIKVLPDTTAPVFTTTPTQSVAENTTAVVTLEATDLYPVTYSIIGGADQSLFSLSGANLSFSTAPDFESPTDDDTNNEYIVQVRANDGTNNTDLTITVSVTDVNDNSPVFSTSATQSVAENTTAVVTLASTDGDAGASVSYSIIGGADQADFSLTGADLSFASAPDFEAPGDDDTNNQYVVQVQANDGVNTTNLTITVSVTDVNDNSPVFTTSATQSVAENTTAVVTLASTDGDAGASVSYSIIGGDDQGLFSLAGADLSFSSAPDFESPGDLNTDNDYIVQVQANDGVNTTNLTITVSVTDVNDNSPVFSTSVTQSVTENTTSVVTLASSDADAGASVSYSIVGGADQGVFSLTGADLSFASVPDFETPSDSNTDNDYIVQVQANDGTNTTNLTITVTVTDVSSNVTIEDVAVDEDAGTATLTLTLDSAVTDGFKLFVGAVDGTATTADSDYSATSPELTFTGTPGETQQFNISILDDMKVELTETILVNMGSVTSTTVQANDIIVTDTATVTINDNDTTAVTIEDISVNEGDGTAVLTATLSNAISESFTVNVTTADGTAVSGSDYTAISDAAGATFTGSAGETQSISISITDDMVGEDVENFTVTISSVSGTSLSSSITTGDSATITINDDDAPQVVSMIPMDDAVDVAIGSDLSITFNQNVQVGTGNILIRNVSDDSTIATVDVAGSEVSIASNVVTINPTADLPSETNIYVEVPAGAFENTSGQGNDAITGNTAWNFTTEDITAPTIVLSTTTVSPTNSSFTVTMTFSEPVTNFDLTDVDVTNGTASIFNQLNPTTFTVLITPSADGEVTVSIAAGALQDTSSNSNDNEASNVLSLIYDITRPTLDISTTANDPTNLDAIPVTFTFSEDMDEPEGSDFQLTNATMSDYTMVSASVYTANILPIADGDVTITLPDGDLEDLAGNTNEEATFTIVSDRTRPTVLIATDAPDPTNAAFNVTITFSEDVTGFEMSDLTVVNGTPSGFNVVSATEYAVVITPTADGPVTVSVPENVAEDAATNGNEASNVLEVNYDATRPTVTISSDVPDPTNAAFTATFTFSEDVTGFEMADLTVDNGTPSGFAGSGSIYTVTITPDADGLVTVEVPENVAEDSATNENLASNVLEVNYDATRPTVVLTTTAADPTNAAFVLTATFSEDVTGFEMSDLVVVNGAPSNFTGSGAVYTATITPDTDGLVTIEVPENVAEDAATNGNEASDLFEISFDATRPVPTITSSVSDPTNAAFDITITFTEDVTGFEMSDLDVGNGTASNFSGSGAVYTATITPAGDGGVVVLVPENVSEDAATNGNEVSNEFSVEYDATNPIAAMSTTAANPVNAPFTVDILWDEDVFGFEMADLVVTNGTPSAFAGSGTTYSVLITPTGAGPVFVDIPTGVAEDLATNPNNPATFTIEYDNIPPLPPNITHISEYTCSGNTMMTGDNTLEISGTAERGSTVEVFIDGVSIGTVVTDPDNGFFTFDYTGTVLADGSYTFTAMATDTAINTGDLSAPFSITVNTVDSDGDGNPDFCDDDDNGNGSTDTEEDCDGDGIVDSQDSDNSSCREPIQQRRTYGFSPNGDGVNDGWVIENITAFPNNTVSIYNRSGKLVFRKSNYQNTFEGISNQLSGNGLGSKLPVGPYVYTIDLGDGSKPVRGWLYINY